jgi:hypothetical protein
MAVIGKSLVRVLQQVSVLAGFARRHGRGQVNQPFRIAGKPAHHLERRRGVLFTDRDVTVQPSMNDALSDNIFNIQQVIELLLHTQSRSSFRFFQERLYRLIIGI